MHKLKYGRLFPLEISNATTPNRKLNTKLISYFTNKIFFVIYRFFEVDTTLTSKYTTKFLLNICISHVDTGT